MCLCQFFWICLLCLHFCVIKNLNAVSLQPSLLAMALLCFEAEEQHDPEHTNNIQEALKSLQQLLNVRIAFLLKRKTHFVYCLMLCGMRSSLRYDS